MTAFGAIPTITAQSLQARKVIVKIELTRRASTKIFQLDKKPRGSNLKGGGGEEDPRCTSQKQYSLNSIELTLAEQQQRRAIHSECQIVCICYIYTIASATSPAPARVDPANGQDVSLKRGKEEREREREYRPCIINSTLHLAISLNCAKVRERVRSSNSSFSFFVLLAAAAATASPRKKPPPPYTWLALALPHCTISPADALPACTAQLLIRTTQANARACSSHSNNIRSGRESPR